MPDCSSRGNEVVTGPRPIDASRDSSLVTSAATIYGLAALLLCILSLTTSRAGTISGTVKAQGKEGADDPACGGKYASRQFKFAERVNYEEMHDFVVYIEGHVGTNTTAPDKPVQVVTSRPSSVLQKGAMFEPHVLPVMRGTKVEWPNHDEIYHNVFSFSEGNAFDLGLYKKDDGLKSVTFTNTGRVDVFCSIHSRMNCIVLVLENPFFASTDSKGKYLIQNVPPGTYKLKAWHERLPSLTKEITVAESGDLKVDFTLGIMNLPKP